MKKRMKKLSILALVSAIKYRVLGCDNNQNKAQGVYKIKFAHVVSAKPMCLKSRFGYLVKSTSRRIYENLKILNKSKR